MYTLRMWGKIYIHQEPMAVHGLLIWIHRGSVYCIMKTYFKHLDKSWEYGVSWYGQDRHLRESVRYWHGGQGILLHYGSKETKRPVPFCWLLPLSSWLLLPSLSLISCWATAGGSTHNQVRSLFDWRNKTRAPPFENEWRGRSQGWDRKGCQSSYCMWSWTSPKPLTAQSTGKKSTKAAAYSCSHPCNDPGSLTGPRVARSLRQPISSFT